MKYTDVISTLDKITATTFLNPNGGKYLLTSLFSLVTSIPIIASEENIQPLPIGLEQTLGIDTAAVLFLLCYISCRIVNGIEEQI